MGIDVILPAGGRIAGAFAEEAQTPVKALIAWDGATVLERTLHVLRASERVGRLVVIGPAEVASHSSAVRAADAVLPEGTSGPDNIFRGLDWLQNNGRPNTRVLIVTTDLPFLTAEAVSGFLNACPPDIEICLPAIRREAFEARFPGAINQYVPLRDGAWTLGCAFLIDADALLRSRVHIERVFRARKSQFAMAQLLGPVFTTRFLFRQLSIPDIERRCSQILGCQGRAVMDCSAELAFDIDTIEDYQYALHSTRTCVR